jgi:hypothetical protein
VLTVLLPGVLPIFPPPVLPLAPQIFLFGLISAAAALTRSRCVRTYEGRRVARIGITAPSVDLLSGRLPYGQKAKEQGDQRKGADPAEKFGGDHPGGLHC